MSATKPLSICLFLLLVLLHVNQSCLAQPINLDPDKWAVKLSKNKLNEVNSLGSLMTQLMEADTLRALRFLDSLQASGNAKGYFFRTYFCMVKADFLYARFAGYDKYKDRRSKELQRAGAPNFTYRIQSSLLPIIHFRETFAYIGSRKIDYIIHLFGLKTTECLLIIFLLFILFQYYLYCYHRLAQQKCFKRPVWRNGKPSFLFTIPG